MQLLRSVNVRRWLVSEEEFLFIDKVYKDCFLLESLSKKALDISKLSSFLNENAGYENYEKRALPNVELIQKFNDLVQIFLQIQKQGDV